MNKSLRFLKKEIFILMAIFILALSLRIIYLFEIKGSLFFDNLILDSHYYDQWASNLAKGDWIGKDVFYGMPLYPYFLGLIYLIFKHNIFIAKLIQLLIGSFNPILLYLITKRFFNKTIAIIASFIAATYNMFIFYEEQLLDSSITLFLYLLSMYLLLLIQERGRRKLYFLTGIFLGLSALSRAGILIWIPFILFWMIFLIKEKKRIKIIASFLFGIILVISLVTLRNYWVSKDFVLITGHSGINFYIGNNEYSDGRFNVPRSMSSNVEDLIKDSKIIAERDIGRPLRASEVSRYWFLKSYKFIKQKPLSFLKLLGKKVILFWNSYEIPDVQDYYFIKQQLKFFKLPLWGFVLICPLSLVGIIIGFSHRRKLFLLYTFIISYMGSSLLYFVNSRYRLPVIPFLIIFASFSLWGIYTKIRMREYKSLIIYAILLLIFFVITNISFEKRNFSRAFNNLGDTFFKKGQYDKAAVFYEKAIREDSNYAKPYNDLGILCFQEDKLNEAANMFKKALELNPDDPRAHNNLGLVYTKQGLYHLAIDEYQQALRLNPGLSESSNNLGVIYLEKSDFDKAVLAFKEALRMNPSDISAHYNLGIAYAKKGMFLEAKEEFKRTITLNPNHQKARQYLRELEFNQ